MKLRQLVDALEAIAPLSLAESWDNVGLLAGDPSAEVARLLLCIDFTAGVADEAVVGVFDAVVSYHPPIFEGLKRVVAGTPVARALRQGIALYSPHTALDAAPGGTNDVLADALGMTERRALVDAGAAVRDGWLKLVTFVPESAVERVSEALFAAGAGRIGDYSSCSFRMAGTGTFLGGEGTNPVVGERGRLERAPEVRLETVVPNSVAAAAVAALRETHPYDEPAFDLVRLAAAPPSGARAAGPVGMGRIGVVAPVGRKEIVARVKAALGLDHVMVAGPLEGTVTRVATAAGSGGELLRISSAQGAEVVLTGEVRHHDALAAAARGVTVIATLHSRSERPALVALKARIAEAAPGVAVALSAVDEDPFRFA